MCDSKRKRTWPLTRPERFLNIILESVNGGGRVGGSSPVTGVFCSSTAADQGEIQSRVQQDDDPNSGWIGLEFRLSSKLVMMPTLVLLFPQKHNGNDGDEEEGDEIGCVVCRPSLYTRVGGWADSSGPVYVSSLFSCFPQLTTFLGSFPCLPSAAAACGVTAEFFRTFVAVYGDSARWRWEQKCASIRMILSIFFRLRANQDQQRER